MCMMQSCNPTEVEMKTTSHVWPFSVWLMQHYYISMFCVYNGLHFDNLIREIMAKFITAFVCGFLFSISLQQLARADVDYGG